MNWREGWLFWWLKFYKSLACCLAETDYKPLSDRQQQRVGSQRGRERHQEAPGGHQDRQGATKGNKRLLHSAGGW